MVPECEVPILDGSMQCCWLCAHAIVDHGALAGPPAECSCKPEDVYPADVLRLRVEHRAPAQLDIEPATPRTQTLVSRCYNIDGTVDEDGPKLVQVFEQVGPGKLRLQSVSVREPTRGERISRTIQRRKRTARTAPPTR